MPPQSCYVYTVMSVLVLLLHVECLVAAYPHLAYDNDRFRIFRCPMDAVSYHEDCDTSAYWRGTQVSRALPGILMAVGTAVVCGIYGFSKYMCNCCGGRHQSPNFCFPNLYLPAKYSRADLVRPRLLSIVTFALCLAGCVWSCSGVTVLLRALGRLTASTEALVAELDAASRTAVERLQGVVPNTTITVVSQRRQEAIDTVAAMHDDAFASLRNYMRKYLWVTYVVSPLTTLSSAAGIFAAAFHLRKTISMLLFVVFVTLGAIVWVLFALYASSSGFIQDSCREVLDYTLRQANVVSVVSQCDGIPLEAFATAYQAAIQEAVVQTCTLVSPLCRGDLCPAEPCSSLLPNSFTSWYEAATAAGCPLSGDAQAKMVALWSLQWEGIASVAALGSCDAVFAGAVPPLWHPCEEAERGARDAMQGVGLLGLGTVLALVVYALGAKRFMPLSYSLTPQYD